jgi:hypothetical protein
VHGKELFRLRKGTAKEDVKEICEEVLPLANLLTSSEFVSWQGKLSKRGNQADAWLRDDPNGPEIPVQIVGAFDGAEFAAEMRELNARGFTTGKARSKGEIEDIQASHVVCSSAKKNAKGYPATYWLLVGVEERFMRLSDMERLIKRAAVAASDTTFERVYLVGLDTEGTARRVR